MACPHDPNLAERDKGENTVSEAFILDRIVVAPNQKCAASAFGLR